MSTYSIGLPKRRAFLQFLWPSPPRIQACQQLYRNKCPSYFRLRHPLTIRLEKDSWRVMGSVPHQRSWGSFLFFVLEMDWCWSQLSYIYSGLNMVHRLGVKRYPDVHGLMKQEQPDQHKSQMLTLLVLGPLDALKINAILHHLPERAAKEKRYWMSKGLDRKHPTLAPRLPILS